MTACLLLKKAGVYNIKKMRTIWLIDAFFSSSCKILAKRTYDITEKLGALAPENFNSRKGLSAIQQATNTRLSFNIALQKRMPITAVAVDLTSCYDQIAHAIASLCMQRLGHNRTTVTCRFSTVQDLEVNVRTAFGDSIENNKQELFACQLTKPPQGVLQGSTDGPGLWAIVSAPVLEILREMGYTYALRCAVTKEKTEYVGCLFVDDAVYFSNHETNNAKQVLLKAQEMQYHLEGLTKATGGAINPEKSFWWQIQFQWTHGTYKITKKEKLKGDIHTHDKHGNRSKIKKLGPKETEKILGVHQAPINNEDAQA